MDTLRKDHIGAYGDDWMQNVWARDDRCAMFSADDGSGAKLFDVQQDPKMEKDLAAGNPDVVKRMYEGYVLRDAGGPLPDYR